MTKAALLVLAVLTAPLFVFSLPLLLETPKYISDLHGGLSPTGAGYLAAAFIPLLWLCCVVWVIRVWSQPASTGPAGQLATGLVAALLVLLLGIELVCVWLLLAWGSIS